MKNITKWSNKNHDKNPINICCIAVEEKNSLDGSTCKEVNLDHFIKPPANLVVLEGDCFDAVGDGGELESYLVC